MMDPNDKWVWADEKVPSPQTSPLLDERLTPIVEWPDFPSESPGGAEPAEPPISVEPAISEAAETPPRQETGPEPAPDPLRAGRRRRAPPPRVAQGTVRRLAGPRGTPVA